MFGNFFKTTPLEFTKPTEESYDMTAVRTNPANEYFRVGATSDGMTTLTIISANGYSTTLSLNKTACEQLIRMIRATYVDEQYVNE